MKKYLVMGFMALVFGCSGKLLATAASARIVSETAGLELLSAVMNRYVGFVNLTEVTRAAGQDLPTLAVALFAEDCVKVVNGAEKGDCKLFCVNSKKGLIRFSQQMRESVVSFGTQNFNRF